MDVKVNFLQGDAIYMFFETKNSITSQGDIAAAVSKDAGATWEQLGVVLDEEWHISYPYVFSYKNKVNISFTGWRKLSVLFPDEEVPIVIILTCTFYLPHSTDVYDA